MVEKNPFFIFSFVNLLLFVFILIFKFLKNENYLKQLLIIYSIFNISIFVTLLIILQRFIGATMGETFLLLSSTFSSLILWIALINRDVNFSIILSFLSFVFLITSQYYFFERSIFYPIPKVLNNNLWIIIHVFSIIIGYGLIMIASLFSHLTIIMNIIKDKESEFKNFEIKKIEKFTNIGFYLIFIGTILGAIWAKIAWGRFWAWDPKETAVFIVILFLFLGNISKKLFQKNQKITLFLPIMVFIIILYTWIGVNLLQKGIHSYGFSETGFFILLIFSISELLFFTFLFIDKLLIFNSLKKKE